MARRTKRLWTDEEKRSICFQATAPGVSVAQVARHYGVNANLIFKWLRDARYAPDPAAVPFPSEEAPFLPVEIVAEAQAPVASPIVETLPENPEELRSFTARLLVKVKAQAILIEKLRLRLAGHRPHRFRVSSETAEQLQLALERDRGSGEDRKVRAGLTRWAENGAPLARPKRQRSCCRDARYKTTYAIVI